MNLSSFVITPDHLMVWVSEIIQQEIDNHFVDVAKVAGVASKFLHLSDTMNALGHKLHMARDLAVRFSMAWDEAAKPVTTLNDPPPADTPAAPAKSTAAEQTTVKPAKS